MFRLFTCFFCYYRPYEVPAEVLAQLSSSQYPNTGQSSTDSNSAGAYSNRVDDIATGFGTPMAETTNSISLLQWWISLIGKVRSSIPDANIVGNGSLDGIGKRDENKPVWRRHS